MRIPWSKWLPHTRTRLVEVFARDRPLATMGLVLLLAAWLPLFLTPFLPFCDLPLNTAGAELIRDTLLGRLPAAGYLKLNHAPVPYWTSYVMSSLLGAAVGPLLAAKILCGLVIGLWPIATMRLLVSLERDPRLALCAFPLVWQQNLYAGWIAFMLGIEIAFFVIAWMIEARDWRDALKIAPFGAVVALTHIQATLLMGLAGVALVFTTGKFGRRLLIHATCGAGAILTTALWIASELGRGGTTAPPVTSQFGFAWHSPGTRLGQFFGHTLGNFARPEGERVAAIAFVLALLGPLALTLLPTRGVRDRLTPLVLAAIPGVLYALLWWEITGPISHWYTYPRYAIILLTFLLLLPTPQLRGLKALALAPSIVVTLWLDLTVAEQFTNFGDRVRPFVEVVKRVPASASVLAMVFDDNDADLDLKVPPYHQLYAYVTAVNHGYTPYLWESMSNPINYFGPQKPAPGWSGAFSLDDHGSKYDFVLVQGFQHSDPVATAVSAIGVRPRLVLEVARWRLYAMR